jgi:Flp pilus assembly pilin Flp
MSILKLYKNRFQNDRGATMVEYILLASGIALVAMIGVANIGQTIAGDNGAFNRTNHAIQGAIGQDTTTIPAP